MQSPTRPLRPAEAARQLGTSIKALRVYERYGLLAPVRDAAGWRSYRPDDMAQAARILALRSLGMGLGRIGQALAGEVQQAMALADQQAAVQAELQRLALAAQRLRAARATADAGDGSAFALPWPWGGERFALPAPRPLTWITGPLGSGKTRLAMAIAAALPGATWLGLARSGTPPHAAATQALDALQRDGAAPGPALARLLPHLAAPGPAACVIDLVEDGLDAATQAALAAWLRRRGSAARPMFLMTRSSAMLDLALAGPDEAILFCPANHAPPLRVQPCPGAPGYEAMASCLASPLVRARTAGVVAADTMRLRKKEAS